MHTYTSSQKIRRPLPLVLNWFTWAPDYKCEAFPSLLTLYLHDTGPEAPGYNSRQPQGGHTRTFTTVKCKNPIYNQGHQSNSGVRAKVEYHKSTMSNPQRKTPWRAPFCSLGPFFVRPGQISLLEKGRWEAGESWPADFWTRAMLAALWLWCVPSGRPSGSRLRAHTHLTSAPPRGFHPSYQV